MDEIGLDEDDSDSDGEEFVNDEVELDCDTVDASSMKLLPMVPLKEMFEKACCCKHCCSPVKATQKTSGTATTLTLTCIPSDGRAKPHTHVIEPERVSRPAPEDPSDDERKQPKESAACFLVNCLLVLAMQQVGLGLESIVTTLAMLGMRSSMGNHATWITRPGSRSKTPSDLCRRRSCKRHQWRIEKSCSSGAGGRRGARRRWPHSFDLQQRRRVAEKSGWPVVRFPFRSQHA